MNRHRVGCVAMKMVITLESGAQIRADVSELTSRRSPLDGGLAELKWTTPAGAATKLHYVRLEEVAAVHIEREPGDNLVRQTDEPVEEVPGG